MYIYERTGRRLYTTEVSMHVYFWFLMFCSCSTQHGLASGTSNTVKKPLIGGRHFIIGTIHISPYIIIEHVGTHISHVNGHVHKIIEWIAKRHDFTFEYVEPLDGAYGALVNGSWNGLVGLLIRGDIDMVATALSVTYPRSKFVDFTFAFSEDPISLLIPYPRLDSTISGIVKPFQFEVWIGIILSLLVVAIALWLISRFQFNVNPQSFHGETGLIPHFWFLFRVVANPNEVITFTLATRLVVAAWCLMAIVFINSYTGILVSYLMAPKFLPLITTVQSLADSRDISIAVSKHTSVEAALFAATSGPLAKLGAHLRAHPQNRLTSLENVEDKVFYQMIAFAHEETTLIVRIHDDLKSSQQCRLAIAKEPLFPDQHAIALPKSSPLTSIFNFEIIWLRQIGLLNYWRSSFLPKPNRCSAPVHTLRSSPNQKLTLNYLSSAFLLYFVGVVFSILAFILELISRKCKNFIEI